MAVQLIDNVKNKQVQGVTVWLHEHPHPLFPVLQTPTDTNDGLFEDGTKAAEIVGKSSARNAIKICTVSHLTPALEYYTHSKQMKTFQFRLLISQFSCCSTFDTVVSTNFFLTLIRLDPKCLLFEQQQLYCPVISRFIHPAPFGIASLVGFFIIPSIHLQV